jgi:hypothetical protein
MTGDDRKGELFVTKTSKLFFQGRSGIVVKSFPLGTTTPDEEHVEVDWLNGHLDLPNGNTANIVDVGDGHFRGIPYEIKRTAIVKWINATSRTSFETLKEEDLPPGSKENNWSAKLGTHQVWNIKLITDEDWALATDPWGDTDHWLPPRWRLRSGPRKGTKKDQIYSFTREAGKYRYEVAMQQIDKD